MGNTAQLLRGSANPIGGQSAIIKLRWGSTPEEMLVEDADEYIKFALKVLKDLELLLAQDSRF